MEHFAVSSTLLVSVLVEWSLPFVPTFKLWDCLLVALSQIEFSFLLRIEMGSWHFENCCSNCSALLKTPVLPTPSSLVLT